METKHTPGPWRIATDAWGETAIESDNERDNADETQVFVLAKSIGGRIHGAEFDDRSEVEANIKLIAAAPDLLIALNNLLTRFNSSELTMETLESAKAAIAKATE